MILQKLQLKNFRNHGKKEIDFSKKTTLIVGVNSAGKTNILEAIYLLATGKSFRVRGVESEMIKYGEETGRVIGEVEDNFENGKITLEIFLTRGEIMGEKVAKKKYSENGVTKRAIDFVGRLQAVYFGPEDLEIIIGSPSTRRKYLDEVLSQTDKEYYRASLSYEKGLRSRNRLLEEMREFGTADRRRLYFWDQLLIKNGNILTTKREEYLSFLNLTGEDEGFGVHPEGSPRGVHPEGSPRGVHPEGSPRGGIKGFKIEYDRSGISVERLSQYANEEIAAGTTLVGPHRDDFKTRIKPCLPAGRNSELRIKNDIDEGRDLSVYGSRGEQRLAVLWLKLGELKFIQEKTKEMPVLLLDDIFSELDPMHRKLVLEIVKEEQAIITTADIGMVEKKWLKEVKIIELK